MLWYILVLCVCVRFFVWGNKKEKDSKCVVVLSTLGGTRFLLLLLSLPAIVRLWIDLFFLPFARSSLHSFSYFPQGFPRGFPIHFHAGVLWPAPTFLPTEYSIVLKVRQAPKPAARYQNMEIRGFRVFFELLIPRGVYTIARGGFPAATKKDVVQIKIVFGWCAYLVAGGIFLIFFSASVSGLSPCPGQCPSVSGRKRRGSKRLA